MNNYINEFIKTLDSMGYKHTRYDLFYDFLVVSAGALSMPFYAEDVKEEYTKTFDKYTDEDKQIFQQLFDITVKALESEFQDFLGVVYMNLGISNSKSGQFFTPYSVSKMAAGIIADGVEKDINRLGMITIQEPACGSGGIIIAAADVLKSKGINYQQCIYVHCTDVDYKCFLMTYIQLSLYGIPATVVHGNTISLETYQQRNTGIYFLNNIADKLASKKLYEKIKGLFGVEPASQLPELREEVETEIRPTVVRPAGEFVQLELELY